MRTLKQVPFLLLFMIALLGNTIIQAQNFETTFDDILKDQYKAEEPGVSALVYKNGKVLYRKAFGMANLELNVPMKPENVFEIGSITKQFTAVSILMMMEQGKLSMEDEITKFIPDYPIKGKKITVHQLLNHTSGIKSYTGMGDLTSYARVDRTPAEIIDYFKNEPMDFEPGEEFRYNNSGYILLGHIIEKASEQSYGDFITENIFKPLGMKNSYYGSQTELIPLRASGYSPHEDGFRNADFISLTIPYAAGSIMSCVDDMLLWHKAVRANSLIKPESRAMAFRNTSLNNGKPTNYGYGWMINEINGTPSIEHGGGIFGFVTSGIYIPNEDVYVIVLTNRDGVSPQKVAVKMTAHVLGKPYPETDDAVSLTQEQMNKWTGNYELEDGQIRTLSVENDTLYNQGDGRGKKPIFPLSEDRFFSEDGMGLYNFVLENGKKTINFMARIYKVKGVETDKKNISETEAITLAPEILEEYVGEYELAPGFVIGITVKDGQIFGQATGQPQFEMFPEAEDTFFLKVVAAKLVFARDDAGKVTDLTLFQGGREMKGVKKEGG